MMSHDDDDDIKLDYMITCVETNMYIMWPLTSGLNKM